MSRKSDAKSVTEYTDYQEFLLSEFQRRLKKNRRYSLRAYSRDLSLRPSALSDIMNGRYGLSASMARAVASNLNLSESEALYFVDLVEMKHGRSALLRSGAEKRLRKLRAAMTKSIYSAADESLYDQWYYAPVLELVTVLGQDATPAEISSRLGIQVAEAKSALEALCEMQYLTQTDSGFERLNEFNSLDVPTKSEAIRSFHKHYLGMAAKAVETQDINQRKFITVVLGFDSRLVQEGRAALDVMSDEFVERFSPNRGVDSVYAVTMHLFRVDQKKNET